MITKKGLEEYFEKSGGTIGQASGFFDDAITLLEYLIKDLEENEPQATNEISVLREAKDYLEQCQGDLDD